MGDSILVSVLLFGHIASAMAFFGGAVLFTFAVGPSLGKMAPTTRRDVAANLFRPFANLMGIFAVLVIVFGVSLVFAITQGDLSQLNPTTPWGLRITIGGGIGVAVMIESFAIIIPSVRTLGRLAQEMPSDGSSPPPPLFMKLQARVAHTALIGPFLMLAAIGFMVSAAGL